MLFGSAMDAIDRYLPDKDKHAILRGMLAFLAVNSTYRGPYTPGSATCLAFALAVPDDSTAMMTKLAGGIGALTEHLHAALHLPWRRDPLPGQSREDPRGKRPRHRRTAPRRVNDQRTRGGVQPRARSHPHRSRRRGYLPAELIARLSGRDHRAAFVQIHFALDGLPRVRAAL